MPWLEGQGLEVRPATSTVRKHTAETGEQRFDPRKGSKPPFRSSLSRLTSSELPRFRHECASERVPRCTHDAV